MPQGHILSARGFLWPARFADGNFGIFRGTNHRFGTFGHDPILGLILEQPIS